MIDLLKLAFLILLVTHVLACFWNLIGEIENLGWI